ncbi:MAG TPA: hypothetical protein VIT67_15980 [Povalibacter sp.]
MAVRQEAVLPLTSSVANESAASAVSWAAILAGAAVAVAASLLLLALGTGLGFASLSPWKNEGPSAVTFTVMSAVWLIIVQWVASGLGGYLTGRLRTKWVGLHTHEVAFRDTAHGFATWAVATVVVSIVVAMAASAAVSGAAKVASTVASGAAETAATAMSQGGYEIDSLFRSTSPQVAGADVREEALRILTKGIGEGEVEPADKTYLVDLIASRTGISQQEAAQRLDGVIAQMKAAEVKAREVADAARKSASAASIITALSMLIGAFIASVAAALAGSQRDDQ